MGKVVEAYTNAQSWLENARQTLATTPRHQPPPHTTHQIRQERQVGAYCGNTSCTAHGIASREYGVAR